MHLESGKQFSQHSLNLPILLSSNVGPLGCQAGLSDNITRLTMVFGWYIQSEWGLSTNVYSRGPNYSSTMKKESIATMVVLNPNGVEIKSPTQNNSIIYHLQRQGTIPTHQATKAGPSHHILLGTGPVTKLWLQSKEAPRCLVRHRSWQGPRTRHYDMLNKYDLLGSIGKYSCVLCCALGWKNHRQIILGNMELPGTNSPEIWRRAT